jgi:hypothetical protein
MKLDRDRLDRWNYWVWVVLFWTAAVLLGCWGAIALIEAVAERPSRFLGFPFALVVASMFRAGWYWLQTHPIDDEGWEGETSTKWRHSGRSDDPGITRRQ